MLKQKKRVHFGWSWLLGCILILGSGCGPTTKPQPILSVGVAIGRGGLGDRAFNDSANQGLQRAQKEFGLRVRTTDFKEGEEQIANLRMLAGEKSELIILWGQEYSAALKKIALEFPEQRFAIVDAQVEAPNVSSVVFRELEGDFLAGALTALLSSSGKVGFLGGADLQVIRRIEHGWTQGVKKINPKAKILTEFAGGKNDFTGFTKPELGLQLTTKLYKAGAEVVYAAAGATALGAIEAAKEQKRLILTTGTDQRSLAPEVVVTSRVKNMDVAVYTLLQELQAATLQPGVRSLDLKAGGVGLASLDSPLISPEIRQELETLKKDLESGKLKVQEYQAP